MYRQRVPGKDRKGSARSVANYAKTNYSNLARVNGEDIGMDVKNGRCFVIKSYTEDDVHKSMKYQIWSSTSEGNKRLNEAYVHCESQKIPLFLFFRYPGPRET